MTIDHARISFTASTHEEFTGKSRAMLAEQLSRALILEPPVNLVGVVGLVKPGFFVAFVAPRAFFPNLDLPAAKAGFLLVAYVDERGEVTETADLRVTILSAGGDV